MIEDLTIMIAEDDADDLQFISAALRRNHFSGSVRSVSDGNRLLQMLKDKRAQTLPDLILLDLNMPFKNGFEALKEMQQDTALKAIPTIVLTSSSSKEDEKKCYELGATKFYHKPHSLVEYDNVAGSIVNFIQSAI